MARRSVALAVCLAALQPQQAMAHAFGARYDLPLPLGLYIAGAGLAVCLSFVIAAVFLRPSDPERQARRFDLTAGSLGHVLLWPPLATVIRATAMALFLLIIASGLLGSSHPLQNFAPTMVWVIWWVGLAFIAALLGNLWSLINPWAIAFAWFEKLRRQATAGPSGGAFYRPYPETWGTWPAIALFLAFVWVEVVSGVGEAPLSLALLILFYSLFTWAGMALFGAPAWLRHGEVFSVYFGLLARFAPLYAQPGEKAPRIFLRPYGAGLLITKPLSISMTAFVVLTLASVTFDGIRETEGWHGALQWFVSTPLLQSTLFELQRWGINLLALLLTITLVLIPCVFMLAYLGVVRLMLWVAGETSLGLRDAAGFFVLSLVPIAIAYHLAHYFSFLFLAGQQIIPLASDPFGWGWDLFGTADYRMDIGLLSAKLVWYLAVAAIVLGHVLAVGLAHLTALRLFKDRGAALRSQIPMVALMIGYTMISLWIVAQPIVEAA